MTKNHSATRRYSGGARYSEISASVYGYHVEIERTGSDFYAHKTCFSAKSLSVHMAENGFPIAATAVLEFQLFGFFFKQPPSDELCALLNVRRS